MRSPTEAREREIVPGDDLALALAQAQEDERRGRLEPAVRAYESIIAAAEVTGEQRVLAEALRRLGIVHRRRHELDRATSLMERSREVAVACGDALLEAEAVNGIAMIHFARGEWEQARRELRHALAVGGQSEALRGRIEQNLGIMANAEGELDVALAHYQRSLACFHAAADRRGCAIAHHNIGMNSADRELWPEAEASFRASLELAESIGDVHLRGLSLLNRTEVFVARQQYEEARGSVGEALQIFDTLGARDLKAEAYKFLGVVYRETGRPQLAEARLKAAVDLASEIGATLAEAEATRELALLYGQMGRNQDTLRLLTTSHRLFGRLQARRDLVDVATKVARLESLYLSVVRKWGASIESSDTYTFGHSNRVARYATTIAEHLGLTGAELTAIRVGAHLHDVGKIRVPHEILNKTGRLTPDEFEIMKQHPLYGLEMLATVDFPWDVKPIIRSHHEKLDGSGYPDGLRGDEIPLAAQIVCCADVYDALTTTRSYRAALAHEAAVGVMQDSAHWWWPDIFDAFLESVREPARLAA